MMLTLMAIGARSKVKRRIWRRHFEIKKETRKEAWKLLDEADIKKEKRQIKKVESKRNKMRWRKGCCKGREQKRNLRKKYKL